MVQHESVVTKDEDWSGNIYNKSDSHSDFTIITIFVFHDMASTSVLVVLTLLLAILKMLTFNGTINRIIVSKLNEFACQHMRCKQEIYNHKK